MNVKEIKEVSSINTSTTISLILSVKINGITVEAIIDTGAHITVINEKRKIDFHLSRR
jgi:predicted aspartyl protease